MAVLKVISKEALGAFIIDAATDPVLRTKLRDRAAATQELVDRNLVELPQGHLVEFHEDEAAITHLILPQEDDIRRAVDAANNGESPYLDDYVKQPLKDIDVIAEPHKALQFRIGEYTMGRCKT